MSSSSGFELGFGKSFQVIYVCFPNQIVSTEKFLAVSQWIYLFTILSLAVDNIFEVYKW